MTGRGGRDGGRDWNAGTRPTAAGIVSQAGLTSPATAHCGSTPGWPAAWRCASVIPLPPIKASRRQWLRPSTPPQCPRINCSHWPGVYSSGVALERWERDWVPLWPVFLIVRSLLTTISVRAKGKSAVSGSESKAWIRHVCTRPCPDWLWAKRGCLATRPILGRR